MEKIEQVDPRCFRAYRPNSYSVNSILKRSFLYIIIILLIFSCSRKKSYVREIIPPQVETITLPEEKGKAIPDFYIVNGERYFPLSESKGFIETGKASWYGQEFHGRPTSSGEIYDMGKKTAAHKTLPLGTYVSVLNLSNNKKTIVRINDRGPFVKGRIIDLSFAAAEEILLIGPGTSDVKITALGKEIAERESEDGPKPVVEIRDLEKGEFTIQVGAFEDKDNAERLADRLKVLFEYVNVTRYVDENNHIFFRLHVSKSNTLKEAGEIEKELQDMGFIGAFIVRI